MQNVALDSSKVGQITMDRKCNSCFDSPQYNTISLSGLELGQIPRTFSIPYIKDIGDLCLHS